jgi:maltoporin
MPFVIGSLLFSDAVIAEPIPLLVDSKTGNGLLFGGYFRLGAGLSRGQTMVDFQLPGATSKYRLGNEANFYYETRFKYQHTLGQGKLSANLNMAGFRRYDSDKHFKLDLVREANLSYEHQGMEYWLGRSYNHRKQIHVLDHYFMNTGQGSDWGVGVNGLPVASGKLGIAYFRYQDDIAMQTLSSHGVDVRWKTKFNNNHSVLWWLYARQRSKNQLLNVKQEFGTSVGLRLDSNGLFSGTNRLVAYYSQGAAIVQSGFNGSPIREDQGWHLPNANVFQISNDWLFENEHYAINWVILMRRTDKGTASNSKINWYSTALRPQFHITEKWNFTFEQGLDYVQNKISGQQGSLSKSTLALQYSEKNKYYQRPTYRLFATYAKWSDDFVGQVGGDAFLGQNHGWNFGVQIESWW